jgi:hypothetical protein
MEWPGSVASSCELVGVKIRTRSTPRTSSSFRSNLPLEFLESSCCGKPTRDSSMAFRYHNCIQACITPSNLSVQCSLMVLLLSSTSRNTPKDVSPVLLILRQTSFAGWVKQLKLIRFDMWNSFQLPLEAEISSIKGGNLDGSR